MFSYLVFLLSILAPLECMHVIFIVPNMVSLTANEVTRTVTSNRPSLRVTWSAPSSDRPITIYKIQYRSGTSGSWMEMTSNGNTRMVTIENLQLGTLYQVRVRAVSDLGDGAWSDTVSKITNNGELISNLHCYL